MDGTKDAAQLGHFAEGIRPTEDGWWNAVALRILPAAISDLSVAHAPHLPSQPTTSSWTG